MKLSFWNKTLFWIVDWIGFVDVGMLTEVGGYGLGIWNIPGKDLEWNLDLESGILLNIPNPGLFIPGICITADGRNGARLRKS